MEQTYLRGDLYYADLEQGVGSEQNGHRPVVIIQNNVGNKYSPTVIVAAITAKVGVKAKLPTHYYINAEDGLEQPSIILLEQLRTIDKHRLENYIGQLSPKHIEGLNHALAISLDLINKINDALIMSLCPVCERHFRDTGSYRIYHLDPNQTEKDTCTYCNHRTGFDCVLIRRK
ncbi:MAG TPA: type II toxin-antitoxin system PemK/MazF family toxin [Clostridiales bacterium]|nr:type II toxin-antitoxin system PemK/MazF family toxin [Clostridiales bacterium]